MKEIFACTSRSKKSFPIMSWIIRFFEGTDGSHALIYWHRKSGKKIAYQSTGHGVNFCGTHMLEANHEILHTAKFKVTDEGYDALLDFCIDNSDKPYSVKSIIGLAMMRACSYFNIIISNPFKDGDYSQVCVETYVRSLKAAGIDLGIDPEIAGLWEVEEDIKKRQ